MTARIRIFGPGTGESILVQFPGGHAVVVDSLRRDGGNPVLEHLQQLGQQTIDVLVLTHPHADHFRGMIDLLEHEQIELREVWRYPGQSVREIIKVRRKLAEDHGDLEGAADAEELARLIGTIEKRAKEREITCRYTSSGPIWKSPADPDHSVRALGPPDLDLVHYEAQAGALFRPDGQFNPAAREPDPKASHHGSKGAFHPALWDAQDRPIAVVTPFRSARLPRSAGLQQLIDHTSQTHVTGSPSDKHGWHQIDWLVGPYPAPIILPDIPPGQIELTIEPNGNLTVAASDSGRWAS